jgi:pimeloyl-ACP methyl ester carboxylesterase
LALDQRSGKAAQGVENKTAQAAQKANKSTKYADAIPDLEAGLAYVKKEFKAAKIIYWGSSYSASLMFYMANKYPEDIDAVLAFSPGEYMKIDGKKIADYAKGVKCPVLITSAQKEADQWKGIYEALTAEAKYSFLPKAEGKHGSKALWKDSEGNEEYWAVVEKFLTTDITKTAR